MINRRLEDLTKVFDRKWKANHNDVAKRGREKKRKFMDKMFNVNKGVNNVPGERASNLHNKMNNAFMGQRQNNINNIVKKMK